MVHTDPCRHLSLADLNLVTSAPQWRFVVTIETSKTDQFFQGAQVVLGATGLDLCPVAALLDYLSSRGHAPGPLFILPEGSPLCRSQFVAKVQQALSASGLVGLNFNSHSFRVGAATSAGAAGVPESTIKVLGAGKAWPISGIFGHPWMNLQRSPHRYVSCFFCFLFFVCVCVCVFT